MKTVFLPRFDAKHEIKWTRAFLEILKNTHMIGDDSHSIHFMTIQDIQEYVNKKEFICWKHLVFSSSMNFYSIDY